MTPTAPPLNRADLLLLVVNTVVGAGVIALPGRAYAAAGDGVYAALAMALVAALTIAASFAVLSRRFEGAGGPYLYTRGIWGLRAGQVIGWSLVFTRLLATATSVRVCAELVATALWREAPQPLLVALLALTFSAVARAGIVLPIRLSNAVGILKLLLIIAIAAAAMSHAMRATALIQPAPQAAHCSQAVLIWFYAFTGFEGSTILAAEARRAGRDLPVALIGGLVAAALLYAALTVASLALVPSLASQSQPVVVLAGTVAPVLAPVVGMLLIVVVIATLPSQFAIAPRLVSAMASDAAAPPMFLPATDGVSRLAVIVYGCGVLAAALAFDLTQLVIASSAVRLISYAVCCAGLVKVSIARQEQAIGLLGGIGALCSITLIYTSIL
jgi:amino acid transporter